MISATIFILFIFFAFIYFSSLGLLLLLLLLTLLRITFGSRYYTLKAALIGKSVATRHSG